MNLDKAVEEFLNAVGEDTNPLHFEDDFAEIVIWDIPKPADSDPLIDWIQWVLYYANEYDSFNSHNEYQCRSGAARSTFDIWRMVKYYLPDTQLADVLRVIGKSVVDEEHIFVGHYCGDVCRQVFKLEETQDDWNMFFSNKTEYGNLVNDWAEG